MRRLILLCVAMTAAAAAAATAAVPAHASLDLPSPAAQVRAGAAPGDVRCAEGLVLVMRTTDRPACLRPASAERLGLEPVVAPVAWNAEPHGAAEAPADGREPSPAGGALDPEPADPAAASWFWDADKAVCYLVPYVETYCNRHVESKTGMRPVVMHYEEDFVPPPTERVPLEFVAEFDWQSFPVTIMVDPDRTGHWQTASKEDTDALVCRFAEAMGETVTVHSVLDWMSRHRTYMPACHNAGISPDDPQLVSKLCPRCVCVNCGGSGDGTTPADADTAGSGFEPKYKINGEDGMGDRTVVGISTDTDDAGLDLSSVAYEYWYHTEEGGTFYAGNGPQGGVLRYETFVFGGVRQHDYDGFISGFMDEMGFDGWNIYDPFGREPYVTPYNKRYTMYNGFMTDELGASSDVMWENNGPTVGAVHDFARKNGMTADKVRANYDEYEEEIKNQYTILRDPKRMEYSPGTGRMEFKFMDLAAKITLEGWSGHPVPSPVIGPAEAVRRAVEFAGTEPALAGPPCNMIIRDRSEHDVPRYVYLTQFAGTPFWQVEMGRCTGSPAEATLYVDAVDGGTVWFEDSEHERDRLTRQTMLEDDSVWFWEDGDVTFAEKWPVGYVHETNWFREDLIRR